MKNDGAQSSRPCSTTAASWSRTLPDNLRLPGLIHRTHGGALPAHHGALEDPTLREKEKLHRREKLRIAAAAARLVSEGQVVILDSGTTTTAIARALRNFQNLTVITNAVNIVAELAGSSWRLS